PKRPVARHLTKRRRNLRVAGFDLLKADHVRPIGLDPSDPLSFTSADAVTVPCGDSHRRNVMRPSIRGNNPEMPSAQIVPALFSRWALGSRPSAIFVEPLERDRADTD